MSMDERSRLFAKVLAALDSGNFEVSERCCIRPTCFDIFARREVLLLLIKILSNIDGINWCQAAEMLKISRMLSASPILIGDRTRNSSMDEGVVYERYGVCAVTPETFESAVVEGVLPLIASARGGHWVKIDSHALRRIRKERRMSLGDVAEGMGVSRRTVYKYEQEDAGAMFEAALRLEELLDESVAKPFDIFSAPNADPGKEKVKNAIFKKLEEIGFAVYPVKSAPFSAVAIAMARAQASRTSYAKSEEVMLTEIARQGRQIVAKAGILRSISETAKTKAFFISFRKDFKKNLEGVPVVGKEELNEIEKPEELVDTLKERMYAS